ncbi:MAG: SgcJ/EcaC family oxidoreductase [Planctomycetes bacterium]|nr:SgcJ/EcaC family oxidoreductase [Planctomycetota bacterium]
MRNPILTLCFAYLVGTAIIGHTTRAAEASPEENAVRQTAKAFADAFNKGDAKAVAALWATDGDYSIGSDMVKGRDAIQKLYEEFFKSHPGSKIEVKIESVRVFAPTVAIEQGTASVSDSPNGPPTASAYSAVHVKQKDGKWLMASVSESEMPALLKQDLSELSWLIGEWAAQDDAAKVEVVYEWIANKNFIRGETKVHAKGGAKEMIGGTQIIGRDALTGQVVSWFFNAAGGHGFGAWTKDANRWLVQSQGATADGIPSSAVNVLYQADDNVMSWQSVNRTLGGQPLPDTKEIVIEREGTKAAETRAKSK